MTTTTSISTESLWFYIDQTNETIGPFTIEEIKLLAGKGTIKADTFVIAQGDSDWKTYGDIVRASLPPSPPPIALPFASVPEKSKKRFLSSFWFVVAGLLFLYPVGLWLLWKNTAINPTSKKRIIWICTPLFFIGVQGIWAYALSVAVSILLLWMWNVSRWKRRYKIAITLLAMLLAIYPVLRGELGVFRRAQSHGLKAFKIGSRVIVGKKEILFSDTNIFFEALAELKEGNPNYNSYVEKQVKAGKIALLSQDTVLSFVGYDNSGYLYKLKVLDGSQPQLWFTSDANISAAGESAVPDENDSNSTAPAPLLKTNEPFTLGDFAYRITGMEQETEVGDYTSNHAASDGAVYVVVHYAITNVSNETRDVLSDDFVLKDNQGRSFSPSIDAMTAMSLSQDGADYIFRELQPGITKEAVTVFEIPYSSFAGRLVLVVPEKGWGTEKREVLLKQKESLNSQTHQFGN